MTERTQAAASRAARVREARTPFLLAFVFLALGGVSAWLLEVLAGSGGFVVGPAWMVAVYEMFGSTGLFVVFAAAAAFQTLYGLVLLLEAIPPVVKRAIERPLDIVLGAVVTVGFTNVGAVLAVRFFATDHFPLALLSTCMVIVGLVFTAGFVRPSWAATLGVVLLVSFVSVLLPATLAVWARTLYLAHDDRWLLAATASAAICAVDLFTLFGFVKRRKQAPG